MNSRYFKKDDRIFNLNIGDDVYFTNYNSHRIYKGRITHIENKNIIIDYATGYGGDVTKMQLRFSISRIVRL